MIFFKELISSFFKHKRVKAIYRSVSRITRKPALIIPLLAASFCLKKLLPLYLAFPILAGVILLTYRNQRVLQNKARILLLRFHETDFGYWFNWNFAHLYGALLHGVGVSPSQVVFTTFGVCSIIFFLLGGIPSLLFFFVLGIKLVDVYKYYLFPLIGLQYFQQNSPIYKVSLDDLHRLFKGEDVKPTTEELRTVLTALFFRVRKGTLPLVKKDSQRAARFMRKSGVYKSFANNVLFREFHGTSPRCTWPELIKSLIVHCEGAATMITEQVPRVIRGGAIFGGALLVGVGAQQQHERNREVEQQRQELEQQRHEQNLDLLRERREQFQDHNRLGLDVYNRIREERRREAPDEVFINDITQIFERSQREYDNTEPLYSSLENMRPVSDGPSDFVLQNIPQVSDVDLNGESKEDVESTMDSLELKSFYEPSWFDTDRNSLLEDILSF